MTGAAWFVGRVGGLAIALGIGVAVGGGLGVACAAPQDAPSPGNPARSSGAERQSRNAVHHSERAAPSTTASQSTRTPGGNRRVDDALASTGAGKVSRITDGPRPALYESIPFAPPQTTTPWLALAAARREVDPAPTVPAPAAAGQSPNRAAALAAIQPSPYVYATTTLPNGALPIGVAFNANGSRAYVTTSVTDAYTGQSKTALSIFNAQSGSLITTIPISNASTSALTSVGSNVVVSPDGSRAYVNATAIKDPSTGSTQNSVYVIDTVTNKVVATISGQSFFGGLALSPDGKSLYTGIGVGIGNPGAVIANTGVATISTSTNKVTGTITLSTGNNITNIAIPLGVNLSSNGSRMYVPTVTLTNPSLYSFNTELSVVNSATKAIVATIPMGNALPTGFALTPDGRKAYLSNEAIDVTTGTVTGWISIVDTGTNTVTGNIALPSNTIPLAVAGSPYGNFAYIAASTYDPFTGDALSNAISVLDTSTDGIISNSYLPNDIVPISLSVSADGTRALLTSTVTDPYSFTKTGSVSFIATGLPLPVPTASFSAGTPNTSSGVVTGAVTGKDPANKSVSYALTAKPAKGIAEVVANGSFTYTPTAAARHLAAKVGGPASNKSDTFTVTVTGSQGGTARVTVTVSVAGKNTKPTGAKATVGSPSKTTGVVTGTLTATDADKDALTFSAPASTSKGTITLNAKTGAFTYTPTPTARQNANKVGAPASAKTDSFTVTISDGYGGTVTVAVPVKIA